jgi:hypothetical protein
MNSQDFRNLQESYMAVYDNGIREKLEFESWVNNLLEEGYDLSDYTWDELYENYIQLDEISQKTATKAYATSTTGEFEGQDSPRDVKRSNEIRRQIKRKFGDKAAQHADRAAHSMTFGRKGAGGMPKVSEEYMDEGKLPLDKERRTKIGNQIGKRLQSSGSEIIGSGSAFMPKGIRNNLRQNAAKKVGEVKKMMGALKSAQKESYDLYDIILSHLLDEGYADTYESAERIMVNMSEEWRDSIIETRLDPRGRPASGPMNVYANPKKPSQSHLDAVKAYDEKQKKKTPEQRKAELDAYMNRKMYS